MPSWILRLIAEMVIKFGWPYVVEWIKRKFPWFPIGPYSAELSDYAKEVKSAKKAAKKKFCEGIGCPPNLKGIG